MLTANMRRAFEEFTDKISDELKSGAMVRIAVHHSFEPLPEGVEAAQITIVHPEALAETTETV